MSQITDYEGTPVLPGDIIAASFNDCEIRKGVIQSMNQEKITVRWISGNVDYRLPARPTEIYVRLHRFLKIGERIEPTS